MNLVLHLAIKQKKVDHCAQKDRLGHIYQCTKGNNLAILHRRKICLTSSCLPHDSDSVDIQLSRD